MPQTLLPLYGEGQNQISEVLWYEKRGDQVYYFHGGLPIYTHFVSEHGSFRLITSQMVVTGNCTQMEIVRAFGISSISMKRYVKKYREEGAAGFFAERRTRGAGVLTADVVARAQELLSSGQSLPDVARQLEIKPDTLRKAIGSGRLRKPEKKEGTEREVSSKSARSVEDRRGEMGMACTRVAERVLASMGSAQDPAATVFEPSLDVVHGGVLTALAALVANGLLRHTEDLFRLPRGFYGAIHIFVALGLMMLARVKNVERLRYEPCGEWGRLLGLDRFPEARTMRGKISLLAQEESVREWSSRLSREWMEADPGMAGTLYVDGHVRVYHGSQTRQPRRYVSRERLCLRGMADYWVNDRSGSPFFVVSTPATDGLLAMLRSEIVPRLLKEVPGQPSEEELAADPLLARFTLVFDREGYSPAFMKEMWQQRIACLSYHKFPGDKWSESEFVEQTVVLAHGASATMKLAERGTRLSNGLWVREVRKLTGSGHQVSLISTRYQCEASPLAGAMFARWSQENFFRYAIQHFDLDRLAGYMVEPVDETMKVINPAWRVADAKVRTVRVKLNRKRAEFGSLSLADDASEEKTASHVNRQADLRDQIELLEHELDQLKQTRVATPKKIEIKQLPETERPGVLSPTRKLFLDTIRMIAWRAETAMANVVGEKMARPGDARALLREIFATEADLVPNYEQRTLSIRLHHLTNNASDEAARHLLQHLNETQTLYPGTDMRLIYEMVSGQNRDAASGSNQNSNQEAVA